MKTVWAHAHVGSNPTPSAIKRVSCGHTAYPTFIFVKWQYLALWDTGLALWNFGVTLWDFQIRISFCRNLLELSAALWYNDANNLIRCGGFWRI